MLPLKICTSKLGQNQYCYAINLDSMTIHIFIRIQTVNLIYLYFFKCMIECPYLMYIYQIEYQNNNSENRCL